VHRLTHKLDKAVRESITGFFLYLKLTKRPGSLSVTYLRAEWQRPRLEAPLSKRRYLRSMLKTTLPEGNRRTMK